MNLERKKMNTLLFQKKFFKEKFIKFCKKPQNQADVFLNLHLAYSAASGENIKKKNVLFLIFIILRIYLK